jgi:uncharacterized protein YjgD (DUF1641 family)
MEEKNIQEQIQHLDEKLDHLLEFVEQQNRKGEVWDDFMKDVTPILHQVGLDAINKMHELDQKGYFETLPRLLKNLSDPALLAALTKVTKAVAEVKVESDKDILSMWQIMKQLRSKEVRKTLTYSLKVIKEIAK